MGFADFEFTERMSVGIDELALFPLFTPELIELMRRLIPEERCGRVATSVIVRARRPS